MLESLLPYAPLGSLLSGMALFLGALVAAATLFVFNLRSRNDLIYRDLSALYKRFWESDDLGKVRRWIDSDAEFAHLRTVLEIVNTSPLPRPLHTEEARNIELLDRFCAIMVEALFIREIGRNRRRRSLVDAMFLDHWLAKFASRPALFDYARNFWPHLFKHIKRRISSPAKSPAPSEKSADLQ